MDQDGFNVRYLTRGSDLVLTPRFSPSTQEITYMEFGQGDPRVYLLNIETGQREIVGNFPGMSFSATVLAGWPARDHELAAGRQFKLFVMDLRSKSTTRLTDTPAIDTSPSYAPDGTRLCFESDAAESRNLCDAGDGWASAAHLVRRWQLFDPGLVAARRLHCVYQTGQRAVFHRHHEARWLRRADSHSGFHNEGPTYAPNGRVLMFFRDPGGNGGPSLFTVDISGRNEQRVPTPGFASDPAWSPLLS